MYQGPPPDYVMPFAKRGRGGFRGEPYSNVVFLAILIFFFIFLFFFIFFFFSFLFFKCGCVVLRAAAEFAPIENSVLQVEAEAEAEEGPFQSRRRATRADIRAK